MKLFCFPSNIESDILAIGAQQVPYCRTPEFSATVKENEAWLLEALACRSGRVIPLTASGTGAMEAVVANLSDMVSRALVIDGGTFGARWAELCAHYSVPCDRFSVPFGEDLDLDRLAEVMRAQPHDVLFMQHHETSSGQCFDVEAVGRFCRTSGTLLVVDAISSFLADAYRMDEWGIGITVLSSHKGLCLPPGLGFVVLGEALRDADFGHRSFYFDFAENLGNLERGQTPYTPAIPLMLQLNERLRRLRATGLIDHLATVERKAAIFRAELARIGVARSAQTPSASMTGFHVSGDARALFDALRARGMVVMPSQRPGFLRATHVGALVDQEYITLAAQLAEWEQKNG